MKHRNSKASLRIFCRKVGHKYIVSSTKGSVSEDWKTVSTMEASNENEHEQSHLFRNDSRWSKHRWTAHYGLSVIRFSVFIILTLAFLVYVGTLLSNNETRDPEAGRKSIIHYVHPTSEQIANSDTCWEPECVNAASAILKRMDRNVKPCENFYEFACGRFLSSTIIPDDKSSVNAFTVIRDKLDEQLRTSIEEISKPNGTEQFKPIAILYKSCMNKDMIEARGFAPLQTALKQLGGWPAIDGFSWKESEFDWEKVTYNLRGAGYPTNFLINFNVLADPKNNTKYVITLDQPNFVLPRGYLMKGLTDKSVMDYYDYMVDIATILGAPKHRAMVELRESLLLEIKLANITVSKQNRRDPSQLYNPTTVSQLAQNYPGIPWKEYLNRLLSSTVRIEEDEIVIVTAPRYIANFEKLIATTPKKIQANYIMWRVTAASIALMNDRMRERQLQFSRALSGRAKRAPRWKECVDVVSGSLATGVGALYVNKFFNEESKNDAIEMVMNIRQQFDKTLNKVKWLDEKTRKSAREKLAAMTNYVAYPDELLRYDRLENISVKLQLSEDKYFENMLRLKLLSTEFVFGKLRKSVNKRDWTRHGGSAVVNAFYSPDENSIQIPAGILQGDFFDSRRPKYMNYGGIGFIIGHEITHGFDDRGRQFDKDGNLFDWWEPATKDRYLEHAKCIIDQYGNYTVDNLGLNINGMNTQGENIADNGGVKGSYFAYENWANENKPEKKLPGLSYTPKQMFWISMANAWCSKYKREQLKLRVIEDSHSPAEFRIIGTLSNIPEFAKDFNCPIGSKMNPEKKCSVW